MASYPPPYPPPPPGYDPRAQRDAARAQQRAQRDAMRAQHEQMRYQMRSMHRSSILGPLLLIAIGVLFLLIQTGHLDSHAFWDWYGHRWPLLLVLAGLLLLAEWGFDQFYLNDPEHPRYRRSLGGGIFVLLFLFGFVGIFAHRWINFHAPQGPMGFNGFQLNPESFDEFFGDKHESDQTLDVAFPAGSSLGVMNARGDVTISGTSDDGKIHVAIHKQVYATSDADAENKAKQLSLGVSDGSDSAVILNMPGVEGGRADLILTVPATATTTVTANRGDIHVASIKSGVTVTANRGDIDLSAITGPAVAHINNRASSLSAHSLGGGITIAGHAQDATLADVTGPVSMTGDFYGATHLEHINGTIHFHSSRTDIQMARLDGELELSGSDLSADQAFGPVVLTTSNHNVVLDRVAGDIAVTNHNGSIDLTAAPTLGNITLTNRNGSVKVILPEHTGYSIQADTTNGEIDSDLPLAAVPTPFDPSRNNNQRRDNRKTLSGTIGAGGPSIHVTTANGDVSIHKGAVAPVPATAPAPPKVTLAAPVAVAAPHRSAAPKAPVAPAPPAEHK